MPETVPFAERSAQTRFVLAIVVPCVFGAIVGVALGASAPAYWILSAIAAIGAILAGLEHPGPRSAALRGLAMGAVYGVGVLVAHAISGADAERSRRSAAWRRGGAPQGERPLPRGCAGFRPVDVEVALREQPDTVGPGEAV